MSSIDLISDSAIQLIIGNKIIIGKLKPILLLSKVRLIEGRQESILAAFKINVKLLKYAHLLIRSNMMYRYEVL